ncbi:MAG: efflux RND transporter permease subunit [Hyphomicrobiaceae bacterium]|nr:efflux RND transporter permease subunit [Hyphomicrobiaceae bacterium]
MTATPTSSPASTDDGGFVGIFVRRPVLAVVVNLLIIVAGFAALQGIEVRELPDVDRPVITVTTTYEGATPESIDAEITAIIESAVSRVAGVTSISSNSSYGRSRVVAEFSTSTDLDTAAMDMRDAVGQVRNQLPDDLIEDPRVLKADDDASPIMRIAVASDKLSEGELTDLVDDVIEDRLAAVEGVASAESFGLRARTIEVRANLTALAARGLALADLTAAIAKASVTTPSGALENSTQQLLVRAEAPITTPAEVAALEIDSRTKVSDVASVRWWFEEATSATRLNGTGAIGIEIIRQARSNTIEISKGVQAAVAEMQKSMPEGVELAIISDDAIFIESAIEEVISSLLLSTVIVILVIFVFLRSLRATIAPAFAIPVSLIGTFVAIWLMGFSINILTLLALVIATGLVVDDAIIVVENIARRRSLGLGPRAAAVLGTREIVFAVLSTTATLAAVFVPISFLPGIVGSLFSEFGFVLAFAVTASSLVALTIVPMIASKVGGGETMPGAPTSNGWLGRLGDAAAALYAWLLDIALRLRWLVVIGCLAFAAVGYLAFLNLAREITPAEDRGLMVVRMQTQQGANLAYTSRKAAEVEAALADLKARGEVSDVLATIGRGGTNRGFIVAPLAPWSERARSQGEIQAELRAKLAGVPGLTVSTLSPNSLGIRGGGQGLRFAIAGPSYDRISDAATRLAQKLQTLPGFGTARTDFDTTQPQLSVTINREAATKLGVPIATITSLVNTMIDHSKAADLFIEDDIVEVQVTAGGRPIDDPGDIANLFVKTADGAFITLSSLVTLKEVAIAPSLAREVRRRSVPVTAQLTEGMTLGEAEDAMRAAAAEILEPDMSIILLGEAKTLAESNQSTALVFGMALLIVFLVLAAQFESVVSALVILFTVPFGLAAAVFAIALSGGTLNVYSQIGLVLVVGIMAKNGILIVEFANQLRDEGADVAKAIRDASILRLRPVMMTMVSTVLGALPLVIATGAGAESRLALGWVIIGGLGFATIFTLFVTPVAYRIMAPWSKPRADETKRLLHEMSEAAKIEAR